MSYLSYTRGFEDNLFMLLLRDHARYMPIVEFFETASRNLWELSWAEAELIAAEVSAANNSQFCSGIRRGMIRMLGADPRGTSDPKLAAAVSFVLKLNRSTSPVTRADVDAVLDAGWSEQTVEDIVGLVAIQKLYNVIATGLGFKGLPEEVFDEIAKGTVGSGGYVASFRSMIGALQ